LASSSVFVKVGLNGREKNLKPDYVVEKKTLGTIPGGLPPEEVEHLQKLQIKLTDFILRLIQAFLRTGYYPSGHPESKKQRKAFFRVSKNLLKKRVS